MIILLDVDGVIADFTGAVLRMGNNHSGLDIKREDMVKWDIWDYYPEDTKVDLLRLMKTEDFWLGLRQCPNAYEDVAMLRQFGEVYAVTSPWYSCKTWLHARTTWLKDNFGFMREDVLPVSRKFMIKGNVLIDDKTENVDLFSVRTGGLGLLWDQPYNRFMDTAFIRRVCDWHDVHTELEWRKGHGF